MSKQVNEKMTKLIRIDAGWHKILKRISANQQSSIKELVEGILSEHLTREVIGDLLK